VSKLVAVKFSFTVNAEIRNWAGPDCTIQSGTVILQLADLSHSQIFVQCKI